MKQSGATSVGALRATEVITTPINPPDVKLYTDGSTRPTNPGPAGWAALAILPDGQEIEKASGSRHTTNNRAELYAAIMGLELIWQEYGPAVVHAVSDSQYIVNGITLYCPIWAQNGWRTSSGKPVENKDLWLSLNLAHDVHTMVYWEWTRGHTKETHDHARYNDRVDKLAGAQSLRYGGELVDG